MPSKRSRKSSSGGKGGPSASPREAWPDASEQEEAEIFRRQLLFGLLVTFLSCVGVWLLFVNLAGEDAPRPVLTATDSAPGGGVRYTVKLVEFSGSGDQQASAKLLAERSELKALAGEHRFRLLEFQNGRRALCVGQAHSPESAQLRELLSNFRSYRQEGRHLFRNASILSFSE